MLVLTSDAKGLDWYLQQAATKLHDALLTKWGITTDRYTAYDRIYRNRATDSGYVAEAYMGEGKYKEVYYDDALAALSFFGVSDVKNEGAVQKADVHLVFFVNLKELKPDAANRTDADVRNEVYEVFGKCAYGLHYKGQETGVDNVLREYPGTRRNELLKYVDMHPKHCFRLNYTLFFNPHKQNLNF